MKKENIELDQEKVGVLLRKEMPEARRDEWFTRKVRNRLPPRRNPAHRWEQWVVVFLFVALGIGVAFEAVHLYHSPVIYVKDLVMMGLYMFSFLGVSLWQLMPMLRN